ncbi:hypothetical protein KIL84_016473 [Mauremys mutica]|uniref:Uncharacterized protein n=1 Tax=Mauremys mutica TaxID=74926 RepID=A0A9D4AWF2_9SAUR|nr:hypothetical protein KIL84_016473 [Mauremys mutica]
MCCFKTDLMTYLLLTISDNSVPITQIGNLQNKYYGVKTAKGFAAKLWQSDTAHNTGTQCTGTTLKQEILRALYLRHNASRSSIGIWLVFYPCTNTYLHQPQGGFTGEAPYPSWCLFKSLWKLLASVVVG